MKSKKFRKYEEGGAVTDADLAAANASPDPIRELNRRKGWTTDASEPKAISFGESFRRAKDAGLKTFSFQGKQFTTKMASENKAASTAKSSAPSKNSATISNRGYDRIPGSIESNRIPGSVDKAPAPLPDSAFEKLVKNNPSLEPIGRFIDKYGSDIHNTLNAMGGIGRIVSGPGRAMQAAKAGSAARDLAVSETPVRFVGASGKRLMNAPRLGSDAKSTDLATSEAMARGNTRKLGMNTKEADTDLTTTEAMKRGGKVKAKAYAKGGSVTRGDGCAQRGHTRGKNL